MQNQKLKKIITTAACIALCVILPMIFHLIPDGGALFSPMHIPVLICGLLCGWQFGFACGILGPIVSHLLTGMPGLGFLPNMMIELALYGLMTGLMMKVVRTGKTYTDVLISLISAMLIGRVLMGIIVYLFFSKGNYGISAWFASYFVGSIPGIIAHIILVPIIVLALMKARLVPQRYSAEA